MGNKYLENYKCPNCKNQNPFPKWEKIFREVDGNTVTDIKCPICKVGILKEVDIYPKDPKEQRYFELEDELEIIEVQNKLDEAIIKLRKRK